VHVIMLAPSSRDIIERFARNSRVPVINGRPTSNTPARSSPTSTLTSSSAARSAAHGGLDRRLEQRLQHLARGRAIFDFKLHISTPPGYEVEPERMNRKCRGVFRSDGRGRGADLVTTDVWTSWASIGERRTQADFADWQVDAEMMKAAKPDALFMHCLPAHRGEEVAPGDRRPAERVWDEAENRLHTRRRCWNSWSWEKWGTMKRSIAWLLFARGRRGRNSLPARRPPENSRRARRSSTRPTTGEARGDLYLPKRRARIPPSSPSTAAAGRSAALSAINTGDRISRAAATPCCDQLSAVEARQKTFPEALHDVRAAIQFLKGRAAELRVSPDASASWAIPPAPSRALAALAGDHPMFPAAYKSDPYSGMSTKVKGSHSLYACRHDQTMATSLSCSCRCRVALVRAGEHGVVAGERASAARWPPAESPMTPMRSGLTRSSAARPLRN